MTKNGVEGVSETFREARRERTDEVEDGIAEAIRNYEVPLEDRVTPVLDLLVEKITQDVLEQNQQVAHATGDARDREIARLLRMIEKRKKWVDHLEAVLVDD